MTCRERRDELLLHAAGALDEGERRDLGAHLASGCPACAGALAEAESVLAHLPMALDPVAPSAGVKRLLMARAAGEDAAGEPEAPARRAPSRARVWLGPALAAGLAAAVTWVAVAVPMQRRQGRLEERIAVQADRIGRLETDLARSSEIVQVMRRPDTLVVSLGSDTRPDAAGRVFWDRGAGVWHFSATGLEPLAPDRTYELWFINDAGEKIPAGVFDVDARGRGELRAEVPASAGNIVVAAVTDEPAGGSAQPTGTIRLAGKV